MFCEYCGVNLRPGETICPGCGKKQGKRTQMEIMNYDFPPSVEPEEDRRAEKPKKPINSNQTKESPEKKQDEIRFIIEKKKNMRFCFIAYLVLASLFILNIGCYIHMAGKIDKLNETVLNSQNQLKKDLNEINLKMDAVIESNKSENSSDATVPDNTQNAAGTASSDTTNHSINSDVTGNTQNAAGTANSDNSSSSVDSGSAGNVQNIAGTVNSDTTNNSANSSVSGDTQNETDTPNTNSTNGYGGYAE